MAEYIEREAVLSQTEILTVQTQEYGRIEVVPVEYIADLPIVSAADVPPVVRGKWKQCFEDWQKQITGDECSVCDFRHYGTATSHYHYCPNCGAKMEEAR